MRCAYGLAIMVVYWVTEAVCLQFFRNFKSIFMLPIQIPIAITALVPMIIYPLMGLVQSNHLASYYMDETNMAIVASILVVEAFEAAHLHRHFAFGVIKVVGVEPRWMLMSMMLVSALLSMLLSNAMAATLIIPVVLEIVVEFRLAIRKNHGKRLATLTKEQYEFGAKVIKDYEQMLILGVAYACSIGGTASMVGNAENLIVADEISKEYHKMGCEEHNPVNFTTWFVWGLPGALIFLPLAWLWMLFYYTGFWYAIGCDGKAPSYVHDNKEEIWLAIEKMHAKLSPMSARQWIVLVHLGAMIVLFATRLLHTDPTYGWELIAPDYVRESTAACLIAVSLFAFPISLPKTKEGKTCKTFIQI